MKPFIYYFAACVAFIALYGTTFSQQISLIPNISPNDNGVEIESIVFNNNLIIGYKDFSGAIHLAKYNGNSYSLIDFPGTAPQIAYNREYTIYNNSIYFQYINSSQKTQLAKYDDNTISLVSNTDTNSAVAGNAYPIVFNNNLYFRYWDAPDISPVAKLATYDPKSGSAG